MNKLFLEKWKELGVFNVEQALEMMELEVKKIQDLELEIAKYQDMLIEKSKIMMSKK